MTEHGRRDDDRCVESEEGRAEQDEPFVSGLARHRLATTISAQRCSALFAALSWQRHKKKRKRHCSFARLLIC